MLIHSWMSNICDACGVVPSLGLPLWNNGRANKETINGVIHILLSLNPNPSRFEPKSSFDSLQKQIRGESFSAGVGAATHSRQFLDSRVHGDCSHDIL